MSPAFKGALLGLTGFGLYALADSTVKFLGDGYSPVQIVAFAQAMTLPMIALMWLRAPVSLRPRHPWLMAVRSLAMVGNGLLVAYAFTTLPLAQAYAIFFTLPLILSVLAWPLLGDRMEPAAMVAVCVGFVGVLVALNPGRAEFTLGHLAAVGGVLMAAVQYLLIRKTGGVESNVAMMLYPTLAQCAVAMLLLPGVYVPMAGADLIAVAALALAALGGTLLVIAAYRIAPTVVVAPTQYSQIAWAALFGALFFAEPMTLQTALGMGLIAAAGLMVIRPGRRATA